MVISAVLFILFLIYYAVFFSFCNTRGVPRMFFFLFLYPAFVLLERGGTPARHPLYLFFIMHDQPTISLRYKYYEALECKLPTNKCLLTNGVLNKLINTVADQLPCNEQALPIHALEAGPRFLSWAL